MANEHNEGKSNIAPFVIIGLILAATIGGIWFVSQSNAKPDEKADKNTKNGNQEKVAYSQAPQGAAPENYKGALDAKVVVEEFADFQCDACARTHPVFNELISEYGNKIKFVFRNFPLAMHPKAYEAAVAAEAAGMQGKFWEMQNLLFKNQKTWANDPKYRQIFDEYAKTIGIDVEKFNNDFLGTVAKTRVDKDLKRGKALNLSSTPTLYINGKSVVFEQMTLAGMKKIIDKELKKFESEDEKPIDTIDKSSEDSDKKPKSEEKASEKKTEDK